MKLILYCFATFYLTIAFPEQNASSLIDGRIIGGHEVSILDHPYHVEIQFVGHFRCGGAIISRTWILTAAHCVAGFPDSYFTVRVGTSYYGLGGTVLNASLIEYHPNYHLSSTEVDYDVAVIQLTQPIALSRTAQIIGLADNAEGVVEGSIGNITGWGFISESGNKSSVLRAAEVQVFGQPVCRDLYKTVSLTDRMFCAGFWNGGVDFCTGDGGGPLVVDSKIIGLSSWGQGCARPRSPGVYANVGVLRDWITNITGI